MLKRMLFLGGVLAALFLFCFSITPYVQAYEGECHLKNCLVPAPTVLMPEDGAVVTTARPEIRGLTWKRTVVKVYIDDQELANVQQINHYTSPDDYYGSFFVVPDFDLEPGEHYIYTIAHSEKPGWYDQSKESSYIDITVRKIVVKPSLPAKPLPVLPSLSDMTLPTPSEPEPAEPSITESELPAATEEAEEQPSVSESEVDIIEQPEDEQEEVEVISPSADGQVDVQQGEIEGGVSVEKESLTGEMSLQEAAGISDLGEILKDEFVAKDQMDQERRNRIIGLAMLGIILAVAIIWLFTGRQQRIRKEILEEEDEGELPPPPAPPGAKNKKQKAKGPSIEEQITVEPIKEEEDLPLEALIEDEDKYWASPPPSPYSPYPTVSPEDELENKERQNDLGI